jgi:hypothetical protein
MPGWAREMRADVKMCLHHLTGNGNPERGVIVRLDRLEQSRKSARWWGGVFLPAVTGIVGGVVGSLFRARGI